MSTIATSAIENTVVNGVRMEGDDMKQIKTVGDAIDFITEKKSAAA